MTTELETQSLIPKGNIINASNSAIPEADKNKQLYYSTLTTHITSSILVTWGNPSFSPEEYNYSSNKLEKGQKGKKRNGIFKH